MLQDQVVELQDKEKERRLVKEAWRERSSRRSSLKRLRIILREAG